jgi:ATP-binding cassette subfamily C protein
VILISHRLANVVDADNIYVMDKGCIVESGNHESLLGENGLYAKLWQTQQDLENFGKESE